MASPLAYDPDLLACGLELVWRVGWSTGLDVPGLPDGIHPAPEDSPTAPLQDALQSALTGDFDRAETVFDFYTSGRTPKGFALEWARYWSLIRVLRGRGKNLPADVDALGPGPSAAPGARVSLLAALGTLCHARQQGDRAIALLEAAWDATPGGTDAAVLPVMLGIAHTGRGDLEMAAHVAEQVRLRSVGSPDPGRHDQVGELMLRLGRVPDAALSFRLMLEQAQLRKSPHLLAAVHYRLGQAARAAGRADEAADAFAECVRLCERADLPRAADQARRQLDEVRPRSAPAGSGGVFCRHDGEVTGVAVSPDGSRLATSSTDCTVRIWDAATGAELFRLKGHKQSVTAVAFSADGTQLASGSVGRTVRIWNPTTGQQVEALWGHQHWVNGVVYSPTGRGMASASDDRTVGLWGPALHRLSGHTGAVYAVAYTPDGRRVVSASEDATCRVWDVETRQQVGMFRGSHARAVRAVAVSPDGRLAASASLDRTIRVWTVLGCEEAAHFTSESAVLCVTFSPDGKWIAAAGEDRVVWVANVSTREELTRYSGHTGTVQAVAFSPDGRHLYSGSADGTVRRWEVPVRPADPPPPEPAHKTVYLAAGGPDVGDAREAVYQVLRATDGVRCVLPDGLPPADLRGDRHRRLIEECDLFVAVVGHLADPKASPDLAEWEYERAAAAGRQCLVYVTPDRLAPAGGGSRQTIRLPARSRNHRRSFVSLDHLTDRVTRAVAHLVDDRPDPPGAPGLTWRLTLSYKGDEFRRIAWSPDGRFLAAGGERRMRVWITATGEAVPELCGDAQVFGAAWLEDRPHLAVSGDVYDVAFSPDESRLAACSGDGSATAWDVATATATPIIQGHTAGIIALAWSRDGDAIAVGADDGVVWVRDARTGGELGSVALPEAVLALAWSPAGGALAAVGGEACVLFTPGREGAATLRPGGRLYAAAWSPDGRTAFTAGRDRVIRGWAPMTGGVRFTLEGHGATIVAVAVSPDGALLASASWDDTVRLWDLNRRVEVARLRATTALLFHTGLAFSPDGRQLATLNDESRAIDVWDLDRSVLVREEPPAEAADGLPDGVRLRTAVPCPDGEFRRVAWSPDGRTLLTGGNSNQVRRWDTASGDWLPTSAAHLSNLVSSVAWSSDGRRFASAAQAVCVWAGPDGDRLWTMREHPGWVFDVAWAPGKPLLASAVEDGSVRVWDADTGGCLHVTKDHHGPVHAVAWSPDGMVLLSVAEDGRCQLFDPSGRQRIVSGPGQLGGGPLYAAVWLSNRRFAVGGRDGVIRVMDAGAGTVEATLAGHTSPVVALAVDCGGCLLASLSGGTLRLWRTDTYDRVAALPVDTGGHIHVGLAFHPSEPLLAAVTGEARAIHVWRLDYDRLVGPDRPDARSEDDGPIPDAVGPYRIVRQIAVTPWTTIYEASSDAVPYPLALKVSRDEMVAGRLALEAELTAGFDHPNIAPYVDHGRATVGGVDRVFLARRLIEGPTLAERMGGPFPPAAAAEVARQVADALHYAHERGVRAVRDGSGSIVVDSAGKPYVVGFTLLLGEAEAAGRLPHEVIGVPYYMSPEQWLGEQAAIDRRSDVFAVGICLYEALTGTRPFDGRDSAEVRRRVLGESPRPPTEIDPTLPAELARICLKALEKVPADRFQTAGEMADALGAWLAANRPRAALWHLALDASADRLAVGDPLAVTLRLHPDAAPDRVPLAVPDAALELTAYVEADGFHLDGGHVRSVPVVNGRPAEAAVAVALTAVASGEHAVRVQVYPGRPADGARPAEITRTVAVAAPAAPPGLRELIDRRAVPDPAPDVTLFAAVEEDPDGPRLAYHLSAPALGLDRRRLDPVPLTPADLAGLRREAARVDGESVRAFGNLLFDRLMPPGHDLRRLYWKLHDASRESPTPWTWLVVADAAALAPWEMVAPYYVRDGKVHQDRFLGERFAVAHWVGRRGLPLAADVPLGRIDLAHYGPPTAELARWRAALGDDVHVCDGPGRLTLTEPGSPSYGLHVLRVARPAGPLIAEYEAGAEDTARPLVEARRLDVTLKRPVAGLSLADGRPMHDRHRPDPAECRLEAGWVLPLLHAGATAVAGPRWPVDGAADRAFWRAFHRAVRDGAALGQAAHAGRLRARDAAPGRADWLAFALFAHPTGRPYVVRAARGFTFVEALDEPADGLYRAGGRYRFRASFRSEPPTWYEGRLRVREEPLDGDGMSVLAAWMRGGDGVYEAGLRPVPGGRDFQAVLTVEVPAGRGPASLLVSFRREDEEVQKVYVKLKLAGGG